MEKRILSPVPRRPNASEPPSALWRDTGINTLRLYPAGATLGDRLNTLGRAIDLVEDLNHEPSAAS